MLYNHFTEELLGLQGVKIRKVEQDEKNILIYVEIERAKHKCPCCSEQTDRVHDYRLQRVKDIPAFGKQVTLVLRKRRYRCTKCGKRFIEKNSFLPRYYRRTTRLTMYIIDKLRGERSFTSLAKDVQLSTPTAIRIFDMVSYPKAKLPEVLSIDEFKGNTSGEKYQCILTDPANRVVLDVLPKRYKHELASYFQGYTKEERHSVKCFVSDMWKPYTETAEVWLKEATQIVDKFHWIRQAIWAFENVRKTEQKKLSPQLRKYFKRSKSLLTKRFDTLSDDQKQQVNVMLYYSVNISRAYWYKEKFLSILSLADSSKAKEDLLNWLTAAESCGLAPFERCAQTILNWFPGICNSFDSPITNGFTEGCNNKIKVLKRNAYGYRNFSRFRNRILHMFSVPG